MLECQTNIYVPAFMQILPFQQYCKHKVKIKKTHTEADPKNTVLIEMLEMID